MSRKAFHISVDFDVHAVTCPGVWLCPKGVVMLRVAMFGLSENTKTIKPCFPLLFHERFRFRKLLKSVSTLSCLQEVLKFRNLHMQLVHLANGPSCCPATVLASFKSPLVDVFYPSPSDRGLNVGVDVDLLLNPTSAFPGIISPKVEISTRVVIEEVINYPSPHEESWIVNPITVTSKKSDANKPDDAVVNRQRPVCHTEGAGDFEISDSQVCCCYSQKKTSNGCKQEGDKSQKPPFITGKFKTSGKPGSMHDNIGKLRSYATKKRVRPKVQVKKMDEPHEDRSADQSLQSHPCNCYTLKKTDGSSICDCMLCKKYYDYFPGNNGDSSSSDDSYCGLPETNEKGKYVKLKNKNRDQLKKRLPSKLIEQKRKFLQETKEPFKPSLPKPVVKQIRTSERSLSPQGDVQNDCPVPDSCCQTHGVFDCGSALSRKQTACRKNCLYKVKPDDALEKPKESKCKCGIYSCADWQRSKNCIPAANLNVLMNSDKCVIPQKKSHRQIFYSNLEDYYRKLYERAREHSAIEEVQACA